MSTDLVPTTDYTAELDRVADPGEFVIASVDRAKHWLMEALDHGDIAAIVELKSQGEAMRVYVMAKQLGKDAELAAAEIVRRAERGLGLAIRKAQDEGSVAKKGYTPGPRWDYMRNGKVVHVPAKDPSDVATKKSPRDFFANAAERLDTYTLADDASDEDFEAALAEARTERNLSRANVVRKVKKEDKPVVAPVRAPIASASAQRRAFNGACTTLSGVAHGLRQIDEVHHDITCEEAAEWVDGLSEARLAIERVIKRLKERANSVPQA